MDKPLVSVIAPVYGVEKYIPRAVESLQSQTYNNWELFLVDDGSKDNSGKVCDEYAKKDTRIKVIHKENGGAPSARNIAIGQAEGKYMFFMDPDDWAESKMLEDLVDTAEYHNSQLVVCGFYIDTYYSDTDKYQQEQAVPTHYFKTQQEFREYAYKMFDASLLYAPWNKLVRADFIKENNLIFPNTFWDDLPWNLSVVRNVERVSVIDKKYYHFIRQRQESEGAKYRDNLYEKREEEQDWMEELFKYWNIDTEETREFLSRRYVERAIGCIENITNPNCKLPILKKIETIFKIINSKRIRYALKIAQPNSKYMKIMLLPMKLRLPFLTYLEGIVISFVKKRSTRIFAILKANR
ncbi:MAG: glycosyltransferase [Oscillospiraceae bacterium]|nr:glycosyltransferase [Oscillospiraceae bacterium]